MICVVCSALIPTAQRITKRYCSERCRYVARSERIGRPQRLPAADRPTDGLTYGGVHHRLTTTRGPALSHSCSDCGAAAQDWAYDNSDQNQRTCPDTGLAYSTDLERYVPKCKRCHREFDNAASTATAQCGTDAGYYRHRRVTRSTPCQPCKTAHASAARRRLTSIHEYQETTP